MTLLQFLQLLQENTLTRKEWSGLTVSGPPKGPSPAPKNVNLPSPVPETLEDQYTFFADGIGAWQCGRVTVRSRCVESSCVLLPVTSLLKVLVSKMWFSYSVCEVVGILLTLFVGLALGADETGELARGKLTFSNNAWFL